jgi:hypothetical protein
MLIGAVIILIIASIMFTRSSKKLFGKGKGARGIDPVWTAGSEDMTPSNPSDDLRGDSSSWIESGNDLIIKDAPKTDDEWDYDDGWQESFSVLAADFVTVPPDEGVKIKWRGAVKADNGIIYGIPYAADNVLAIDTATGLTTTLAVPDGNYGISNLTQKWVDAVLAPNGKIYANPHGARNYLIIDTTTTPATVSLSLSQSGAGAQTRGGAYSPVNQHIYSTMFSASSNFKSINTNTDTTTTPPIPFTRNRNGPIYDLRPNWAAENQNGDYDRYWGAVANADGTKIYGTPWGADCITILDVAAGTASEGTTFVNGGLVLPEGPFDPTDKYFSKYSGGTLSSATGNIYMFPRLANKILKINTSDDTTTEISLPESFLSELDAQYIAPSQGHWAKSFSSVEGADNIIYSVPWNHPYLFWIDPTTDAVGYRKISDTLNLDTVGISGNFYTYGAASGNDIYWIPGSATKVVKMSIPYQPELTPKST